VRGHAVWSVEAALSTGSGASDRLGTRPYHQAELPAGIADRELVEDPGTRRDQWKLSPQAQEPVALGLSMVKPCFSIVSTKSIVAPVR
jgi:hypothetical protein